MPLRVGAERPASGDGERKTLISRQITFEPLPARAGSARITPDIKNMSDIEPKTEAWSLESLQVNYKDELWSIRCGGACQPEYNITAHTLEQAVSELVKQVTRDAIEDEAREWQNGMDEGRRTQDSANTRDTL